MNVYAYSQSPAFRNHLDRVLRVTHFDGLELDKLSDSDVMHIVHASSFASTLLTEFINRAATQLAVVAIADDIPSTALLVKHVQSGASGYCNSFMAVPHYQQMISLLSRGGSWFPPAMLSEVFAIAGNALDVREHQQTMIGRLTAREREVAKSVADGRSSKDVAQEFGIAERTVKSHLSRIYEKLNIKDRMELIIYLNDEKKVHE